MAINREALEAGRAFEQEFAERYGLEQTSGSGNGIFKLDMGSVEVVIETKWTENQSWAITAKEVRKMRAGASGPGSRDQIGILVGRIEGLDREVAVLDVDHLFAFLRGEVTLELRPSKMQSKLAAADPLAFLNE